MQITPTKFTALSCVGLAFALILANAGISKATEQGPDSQANPDPQPQASTQDQDKAQDDNATQETSAQGTSQSKPPWRGSYFVWRNALGTATMDKDFLTYNPYYAMVFTLLPRWWFTDKIFAKANLDITRELTNADDTTYRGETLLGDLSLGVGMSNIWTIPVVDVNLSADLNFYLPTSKASLARTLVLAIRPGVRFSRGFDLLEGFQLGLNLRTGPSFHRYTTAERETSLISSCSLSSSGCDSFYNTGRRNPAYRFQWTADAWLGILPWLDASLVYGQVVDWLYSFDGDAGTSFEPEPDSNARFLSIFAAEITLRPVKYVDIIAGYQAISPQLGPDSNYYNPFYNPYSVVYIDVRIDAAVLISTITGGETQRSNQYDL